MDYAGKIINKTPVTPSQTSASGVWTLDDAAAAVKNNTWPIANVPNPISRSLRFNSADSAYLNRTPASAGNRRTFTLSFWIKSGSLAAGTTGQIMGTTSGTYDRINFGENSTAQLSFTIDAAGTSKSCLTPGLYRDPSAWYHFVVAVDTTQATSTNRVKIYANGVQQTLTGTFPDQNYQSSINNNVAQYLGSDRGSTYFFSGYMAQVQFIDGQALDASYFGMTDPRTGAWISKPYTGTYGNNGFYLNFSDNTNTTTLGTDYSGNSNTWTTNNFSVTAGSDNDSLTDVPTPWIAYNTTGDIGGVVRGNYATFNPLSPADTTFSNGNLKIVTASPGYGRPQLATFGIRSNEKYYVEYLVTSVGASSDVTIGIDDGSIVAAYASNSGSTSGIPANFRGYRNGGGTWVGSTYTSGTPGVSFTNGDIISIAVDRSANEIKYYKNGSLQYTQSIASTPVNYFPTVLTFTGSADVTLNAGQRPFAYTPPAGFKSLCTTNLPEPTILDGGDYFNALLWTGNSPSTQSVTGVGFQPDLVWTKDKGAAYDHTWFDAVRGATKFLRSNTTGAEETQSDSLTSFNSNGFSVGADSVRQNINRSGASYVTWAWKANGAGVTNSQGTITATVSANTTAGFSIVAGTTLASGTLSYGHGLGVTPAMVIYKSRDTAGQNWWVWHQSLPNAATGRAVKLNSLDGEVNGAYFGTPSVSDTVVTVAGAALNSDGFVSYVFAAVPGFSAFGSYNGVDTGKLFVYTGFRPAYVLLKKITSSSVTYGWPILDKVRPSPSGATEGYNPTLELWADSDTGQLSSSSNYNIDLLSNGFCINDPANSNVNSSGNTYIYAAFASNPFKYSNAR